MELADPDVNFKDVAAIAETQAQARAEAQDPNIRKLNSTPLTLTRGPLSSEWWAQAPTPIPGIPSAFGDAVINTSGQPAVSAEEIDDLLAAASAPHFGGAVSESRQRENLIRTQPQPSSTPMDDIGKSISELNRAFKALREQRNNPRSGDQRMREMLEDIGSVVDDNSAQLTTLIEKVNAQADTISMLQATVDSLASIVQVTMAQKLHRDARRDAEELA